MGKLWWTSTVHSISAYTQTPSEGFDRSLSAALQLRETLFASSLWV